MWCRALKFSSARDSPPVASPPRDPATIGGTLDVALLNPFFPTPGETFEIMTFASHSGEFATVTGDVGLLDPVTFLLPHYSSTNLLPFTAIPGDGNLKGDESAAD